MKEYWENKLRQKMDFIANLLERAVREEEKGNIDFAEKIILMAERHENEVSQLEWEISKY